MHGCVRVGPPWGGALMSGQRCLLVMYVSQGSVVQCCMELQPNVAECCMKLAPVWPCWTGLKAIQVALVGLGQATLVRPYVLYTAWTVMR